MRFIPYITFTQFNGLLFSENHFVSQPFFTVKVRFQYLQLNHQLSCYTVLYLQKIGSTTRVLGATNRKYGKKSVCLLKIVHASYLQNTGIPVPTKPIYLQIKLGSPLQVCKSFHIALLGGEKEDLFTVKHCVSVNNIQMS